MDTFLGRYKNILVLLAVLLAQFVWLAMQIHRPGPGGVAAGMGNGSALGGGAGLSGNSLGVSGVGTSGSGTSRLHASALNQTLHRGDEKGVHVLRRWVTGLISPPEKLLARGGSGVRGLWDNYLDLRGAREQNQQLRDEVDRLRLEQAGLLEDARQGQRLESLLGFQHRYASSTVAAQVIGTSGSDQSRVLYVDKGAKDGLAPDQPVITPDGIVGKVKDVFPHTAQILLINDQTSGAGVVLQKTRLRGVLRGNAYGQPELIDILPDERIKPGELVLTSGGDQIFPRGLPVGTVEKVETDPDREPYVDVVVKPAANLAHLEEVLVVTGITDQLPPATKKDLARSQAVGAADAEQERAAQVLADRLPGLSDPNAPDTTETASAEAKPTGGEDVGRPIQPPQPLHPDRFSPNAAPPAAELTPGKAPSIFISAQRTAELEAEGARAAPRPHATVATAGATEPGAGRSGTASGAPGSPASSSPIATRKAEAPGVTGTPHTGTVMGSATRTGTKATSGAGKTPVRTTVVVDGPDSRQSAKPATSGSPGAHATSPGSPQATRPAPAVHQQSPYVEPKPVTHKAAPPPSEPPQ